MLACFRTKDGTATCTSAPIRDDERFEYFDFLNDAQCFEHTEGGIALDARASLVSLSISYIIIMTIIIIVLHDKNYQRKVKRFV